MIGRFFDAIFGCHHSHYSFPITVRAGAHRSRAATATGTYVVCLDCGKEFGYDWKEMRVLTSARDYERRLGALATKHAA